MSNSPAVDHRKAADTWSEIRTRDHVMRYRRMGFGRAVLVLQADEGGALCPALARSLVDSGNFRLILPELPDGVHLAGWLADFLEGIGATDVSVIAEGCFTIDAIELAMLGAELITRVVVTAEEQGPFGRWCNGWQEGALESVGRASRVPLLLIHRGQAAEQVDPLVRTFLAGN